MKHLYALINKAEMLDNTIRRASAQAKLRYLGKIRGIRTTAKQYVKVEKVPGVDVNEIGTMMRKITREHDKSTEKQESVCSRIHTVQKAERTFHLRARDHRECAKTWDQTKMHGKGTQTEWKATKGENVGIRLIEESLDVPKVVQRRDLSRAYRAEVARVAEALRVSKQAKNEIIRGVSCRKGSPNVAVRGVYPPDGNRRRASDGRVGPVPKGCSSDAEGSV